MKRLLLCLVTLVASLLLHLGWAWWSVLAVMIGSVLALGVVRGALLPLPRE